MNKLLNYRYYLWKSSTGTITADHGERRGEEMSPESGWIGRAVARGPRRNSGPSLRGTAAWSCHCAATALFKPIKQAYDDDCRRLQTHEDIEVRP